MSYIHTTIGTTLDQMTSSSDFHLVSWQNGLGLGGSASAPLLLPVVAPCTDAHCARAPASVVVAVLIPVLLRRAFASDLADAASDPAASSPDGHPHAHHALSAPLLHPRESLSLDGDRAGGASGLGTRRELLDGTTRSSTDGSARVAEYAPAGYHDEDGLDGEEQGRAGAGGGGRPVLREGAGSADKVSRLLGVRVGGGTL